MCMKQQDIPVRRLNQLWAGGIRVQTDGKCSKYGTGYPAGFSAYGFVKRSGGSVIILAGILLCMTAVALYGQKSIRVLEDSTFVRIEEGTTGL